MRRLVYSVATSLDGFIGGPDGAYDWITRDPTIDFAALYTQFDTLIMGRRTYELAIKGGQQLTSMGMGVYIVSTTLKPEDHSAVTVISKEISQAVATLKAASGSKPGKDIWLFGGAVLFRSMLDAGLVDVIRLSVMPIMLGNGIPLLPAGMRIPLHLDECKHSATGIVQLSYSLVR